MSQGSPLSGNEGAMEPGPDMSARQSRKAEMGEHISAYTLSGRCKLEEALSQAPAPGRAPHRERLLWLQARRTAGGGLWVACEHKHCRKFRFLKDVHDPMQLPDMWYCRMNPDARYATCSVPEVELSVRAEEQLLHSKAAAGSVVWARLDGFPSWPALVDDDPDTEQYYWLDQFSDVPTYYHVVFFDEPDHPVERAWVSADAIQKYKMTTKPPAKGKYFTRLTEAQKQANFALGLSVAERLKQLSFVARYRGTIGSPRRFSRRELLSFHHFSDESCGSVVGDSDDDVASPPHQQQPPPAVAPRAEDGITRGSEETPSDDTELYTATAPTDASDANSDLQLFASAAAAAAGCGAGPGAEHSSLNKLSTRAHKDSDSDDFEFE